MGRVHLKDKNRRSSHSAKPHNESLIQPKMILPSVSTRVKKPRHESRIGIDTRQVGALVQITVMTGKGQIRQLIARHAAAP